MASLLLAIACGTLIALILKQGERQNLNRFTVLAANYSMATGVALFLCINGDLFPHLNNLSLSTLLSELSVQHISDGYLSTESSALWAILIGIPTGVLYFLGFFYYQRAVSASSVAMAGSYAKLGILVPVVLSLLLWKESPTHHQWMGMVLAMVAIAITNIRLSANRNILANFRPVLLLLFITSGTAEFTNKVYQRYGMLEMKDIFLLVVFSTALMVSLSLIRTLPTPREIVVGFSIGIPNVLGAFFLIKALAAFPATVVFPAYSAGSIALIAIGGRLFFSEKLTPREYLAILLTMIALIMIN